MTVCLKTTTTLVVYPTQLGSKCERCYAQCVPQEVVCGVYTALLDYPLASTLHQFTTMHTTCAAKVYGEDAVKEAQAIFASVAGSLGNEAQG